ncbi:putative pyrroline-5-carboxylate reductase, partial [Ostertagia ostertagi]
MSEFSRLCQAAGIMKPMFLFIGGGNMASALVHGCIESVLNARRAWQKFRVLFKAQEYILELAQCVQIRNRRRIIKAIGKGRCQPANPRIRKLSSTLYHGPVIRIMPNTAASVGSSASILCVDSKDTAKEKIDIAKTFASKVGSCVEVDSKTFNAYGVVSGSAPAWAYMFMESLADGAVYAGCSREIAMKLAAQSLLVRDEYRDAFDPERGGFGRAFQNYGEEIQTNE